MEPDYQPASGSFPSPTAGLEIALQADFSSPREASDLETPIRISDEAVAMGFQTIKSMEYQPYLPEYPKTDTTSTRLYVDIRYIGITVSIALSRPSISCSLDMRLGLGKGSSFVGTGEESKSGIGFLVAEVFEEVSVPDQTCLEQKVKRYRSGKQYKLLQPTTKHTTHSSTTRRPCLRRTRRKGPAERGLAAVLNSVLNSQFGIPSILDLAHISVSVKVEKKLNIPFC
ncbi:hypothetical protein V8E54_009213 [Elaphomyces granulatus]